MKTTREIRIIKGDKEYILLTDDNKIVATDLESLLRCVCIALSEKIPPALLLEKSLPPSN